MRSEQETLDALEKMSVKPPKQPRGTKANKQSTRIKRQSALVPLETLRHWRRVLSMVLDAATTPYVPAKLEEAWKIGLTVEREMASFCDAPAPPLR